MKGYIACLVCAAGTAATAGIMNSAEQVEPLAVGASIPNPALTTLDGTGTTLKEATGSGPAVIVFFRGGWCPYCMRHLAALREVIPEINDLGYSVVAISPDTVDSNRTAAEEKGIDYTVLSDSNFEAVRAFNLAFKLDDATLVKYGEYGIELVPLGDTGEFILPVPAVYVVNAEGTVTYLHFDPNYRERLDPQELLEAVKKL